MRHSILILVFAVVVTGCTGGKTSNSGQAVNLPSNAEGYRYLSKSANTISTLTQFEYPAVSNAPSYLATKAAGKYNQFLITNNSDFDDAANDFSAGLGNSIPAENPLSADYPTVLDFFCHITKNTAQELVQVTKDFLQPAVDKEAGETGPQGATSFPFEYGDVSVNFIKTAGQTSLDEVYFDASEQFFTSEQMSPDEEVLEYDEYRVNGTAHFSATATEINGTVELNISATKAGNLPDFYKLILRRRYIKSDGSVYGSFQYFNQSNGGALIFAVTEEYLTDSYYIEHQTKNGSLTVINLATPNLRKLKEITYLAGGEQFGTEYHLTVVPPLSAQIVSLGNVGGLIPGCKDPTASNYDSIATVDNLSCIPGPPPTPGPSPTASPIPSPTPTPPSCPEFGDIGGCMEPDNVYYNACATFDDGSCETEPEVIGD